jgi:hypothetical protein
MRPKVFQELWSLAVTLAPKGGDPRGTFDCGAVGLILRDEEGPYGYDSTPLNADTFAKTGGDGVHFSFLLRPGQPVESAPVVMTVPMAFDDENHVVGEDLRDFLSLGCHFGYFCLEQLAYDREGTVAEIQASKGPPRKDPNARLLAAIREHFGLTPWRDVAGRLELLRERYGKDLQRAG